MDSRPRCQRFAGDGVGPWWRVGERDRFAAIYDGTHFAKERVLFITNSRRMGAEGYLCLEEDFGAGFGPGI